MAKFVRYCRSAVVDDVGLSGCMNHQLDVAVHEAEGVISPVLHRFGLWRKVAKTNLLKGFAD